MRISGKENELCFRYVEFEMLVGYLSSHVYTNLKCFNRKMEVNRELFSTKIKKLTIIKIR